MSTPAMHRGIVVGVDGSPASKVAVDWAARDAVMRNVPLTVVSVLDPSVATTIRGIPMPMPPEFTQWQQDEGRTILNDALKTVEDSTKHLGPVEVGSELMIGPQCRSWSICLRMPRWSSSAAAAAARWLGACWGRSAPDWSITRTAPWR
jgi:Universal stress protein family